MKLLAFDLDGTVVTKAQNIPNAILEAVGKARGRGHVVTVLTGRTETSAKPYLDALEVRAPYATAQGALVSHADGRVMFEARLPGQTVRDVVSAADAPTFFVATGTRFYVPEPDHAGWDWARAEGHVVTDYRQYLNENALKIMLVTEGGSRPGMHARLLERLPALSYYPWQDRYLEVTAGEAHKGAALARIAANLGIARADVIAFGDGHNDLTMLEWAGHGVAVGEFEAHHAGVAAETIPPPEEHGVAAWLEANL